MGRRGRPKGNAGAPSRIVLAHDERPTRRTSSRLTVPDSEDLDSASDTTGANSSFMSSNQQFPRTIKGVFVDSVEEGTANSKLHGGGRESTNSNPSSVSSPNLFTRENSNEIETPDTTLTTPAGSVNGLNSVKGKRSLRASAARNGANRNVDPTENMKTDEQLALELQEEEYASNGSKRVKLDKSKGKRQSVIEVSSDDSSLSEADDNASALSDSSDDVPLSASRKRKANNKPAKAGKPAKKQLGKTILPTRAARTSASNILSRNISAMNDGNDEEDDSELSDFVDDEDDDGDESMVYFEGTSDEDNDEVPEITNAVINSAAPTQANAPNTPVMRGRFRRRGRISRAERERAKLEKSHPEIITMWDDLRATPRITPKEAPQPQAITRRLKGFQLEGLNWMVKQEKTKWKGGLLGDEMGMGKTIQAVSLIMSDHPAKHPTLVVVPPVALMQWTNEINDYTNGKLKVLVYHGTNSKAKKMSVKELKTYNVIMISYSGLESIYRRETKGWNREDKIVKEDSAIHAITFHRIILDEAHSIKSRTTGVAKACFALNGKYKWCLSGTPVQNRIGEFFSLLRFIGVEPFANYFCKSCPCSTMHWSTTPDYRCTHCKHRALDHVSVFNQEILNPIISGDTHEQRKEALGKLRLLTDLIMLRRMKRDQTASMELPPKEVIVHNEFFGEIERDFSSSIMSSTARKFDTYVSRGVMLNNYANIFGLIMQMRQVSDHPDLLLKKHGDPNQNVLVCNICDEPAEEAIRSRCKHEFCRTCVRDYIRTCEASEVTPDCPRCHIPLAIDFDQPDIEQDEESVKKSSIINRIKMENWTSSTKIEMLVYDLYKLRSKKQTLKSIVFSQFTSMLQLIEWRLRRAGFNTVMLDGSMTPIQRQKSIEYFMNNTDVEVFLVSLKAGGVALNLTEASRVFIIDPWWNPAAEWQSADRCHRIGQKRPCVIKRLCIEDSVESRIVMLQEKKANLINGTVNGDDVAMDKLTPEDMQFLFRGS